MKNHNATTSTSEPHQRRCGLCLRSHGENDVKLSDGGLVHGGEDEGRVVLSSGMKLTAGLYTGASQLLLESQHQHHGVTSSSSRKDPNLLHKNRTSSPLSITSGKQRIAMTVCVLQNERTAVSL